MASKLVIALALGLMAGATAAYMTLKVPDSTPSTSATGRVAIGGPFSLIDTSGQKRTDKDFAGKPMLVFFGFTNCPDVCPSGLQNLTVALDKLGDRASGMSALFITVDPDRDTPQKLAEYMKSFHPRIEALTGSADEVNAAIKTYRVYAVKVPYDQDPTRYNVDHSSFFYLMNASGEYVKHFPHTADPDALASALESLLAKS